MSHSLPVAIVFYDTLANSRREIVMKYGTFNLAKRGSARVYHHAKIREPLITLEIANNREFIRKLRSFILFYVMRLCRN